MEVVVSKTESAELSAWIADNSKYSRQLDAICEMADSGRVDPKDIGVLIADFRMRAAEAKRDEEREAARLDYAEDAS